MGENWEFGGISKMGLTSAILCGIMIGESGYDGAVVISAIELNIRIKAFFRK